jgi:hypothetical protein
MTASGAGATVPVAGAVSINAEIRHLTCELFDALRKFSVAAGCSMLVSAGGETTSVMQSAQVAAASKSSSGWQAKEVCILVGSWLNQIVRM